MFNCNYLELSKENVLRNIYCHIDHTLLESSSWYGSTKFLNWFLKQLSCPRNVCTKHWRKLPNLTAFFDIYLYLKSKNNGNFVKRVKSFLKFAINYFGLCIFAKFLTSFLKAQVIFPLNFASIFSAISNIIHFGQSSQLKRDFFRFSSA